MKTANPVSMFRATHYLNINKARMLHLASLRLVPKGCTVLELGAGIGDITASLVDMGCGTVTRVESRKDNCEVMLRERPEHPVICHDLMEPVCPALDSQRFDICVAYGIMYHLSDPTCAIEFMRTHAPDLAFVETCVSMGEGMSLNPVYENKADPTQSERGGACRPTRKWMFAALSKNYEHVYCPATQPDHPQFPEDWQGPAMAALTRAVFVCSSKPIPRFDLLDHLPAKQTAFRG